jgi:hypothetical protein
MLESQLSADLDRRAGAMLSAARCGTAESRRAAAFLRRAGDVARRHGLAGIEGYLAALGELDTPAAREAQYAIRRAVDDSFTRVSVGLWSGRPPVT